jgi:hypothetical protein
MDRRSFVGTLGGLQMMHAAAPGASAGKTRYYLLEAMYLKNGTQVDRVHEWLGEWLRPALDKLHSGPKLYLQALVAPHMPQILAVYGYESLEQLAGVQEKLSQNRELMKKSEEIEGGPEPLVEHQTNTLLAATEYSPEMTPPAEAPGSPRIFELRVYHSPTWRQLRALHERFAGPEIRIFHRVGVHPVFYTSTLIGANLPNLTYMIPFESLAAREKAWSAFAADPEWVKVRRESIEKHGQISSIIQISLYQATRYSPIR